MAKRILKTFSMSLGFCIILVSILFFVAPVPNPPPESVTIGMLATGIILLGWPIYTYVKAGSSKEIWKFTWSYEHKTDRLKEIWKFTLDDGKHTVELERGLWSHKKTITVDGVEIIRSGWVWVGVGPAIHFEVAGIPCVLDPINLWVRGELIESENTLQNTIRQVEKVRKTEVYGQEQKAGVFTKVKDALTTDHATIHATELSEALLQHLRNLGVEVRFASKAWLSLEGESIDGILLKQYRGEYGSSYEISLHYMISGMKPELASRLKARSKEIKEHKFWGKVRDVRWVGGQVAQSLNSDVDLLHLQVKEGQTKIKIISEKSNGTVHIVIPAPGEGKWFYSATPVHSFRSVEAEQLPTRESFNLYNRIAQHIRSHMEQ